MPASQAPNYVYSGTYLTITDSGSVVFDVPLNSPLYVGFRVRAICPSSNDWMEGEITNYSGNSLTVLCDSSSPTPGVDEAPWYLFFIGTSTSITSSSLPRQDAVRLQTDGSGDLTWTFASAFSSAPIITCVAEGNSASTAAGFVPTDYATVISVSTTSVTIKSNRPSTWFHLTASEPT